MKKRQEVAKCQPWEHSYVKLLMLLLHLIHGNGVVSCERNQDSRLLGSAVMWGWKGVVIAIQGALYRTRDVPPQLCSLVPIVILGTHPDSSNKVTRVKCIQVTYQTDKMNYWSEIITCISIISTYYNFFIIYY